MARKMANKLDLKRDLKEVSVELAALNRELALKMISLRAKDDVNALEHAIKAYRGAITLASMLGDEEMRRELKRDYSLARNLLGHRVSDPSLKGVA